MFSALKRLTARALAGLGLLAIAGVAAAQTSPTVPDVATPVFTAVTTQFNSVIVPLMITLFSATLVVMLSIKLTKKGANKST